MIPDSVSKQKKALIATQASCSSNGCLLLFSPGHIPVCPSSEWFRWPCSPEHWGKPIPQGIAEYEQTYPDDGKPFDLSPMPECIASRCTSHGNDPTECHQVAWTIGDLGDEGEGGEDESYTETENHEYQRYVPALLTLQ